MFCTHGLQMLGQPFDSSRANWPGSDSDISRQTDTGLDDQQRDRNATGKRIRLHGDQFGSARSNRCIPQTGWLSDVDEFIGSEDDLADRRPGFWSLRLILLKHQKLQQPSSFRFDRSASQRCLEKPFDPLGIGERGI